MTSTIIFITLWILAGWLGVRLHVKYWRKPVPLLVGILFCLIGIPTILIAIPFEYFADRIDARRLSIILFGKGD